MKMKEGRRTIDLKPVEVVKIEQKGLGDRCCIDLSSSFVDGLGLEKSSGLLTGALSKGFFLIHAENIENPHVNQRPFRVNAGAVSLYIITPEHGEDGRYSTKYLWELRAGDKVLATDFRGHVAEAVVSRNKIERRPLTMITALHPTLVNPYTGSLDFIYTFIQTAETTNLVGEKGEAVPLANLKAGDKILAYTEDRQETARHFGTPTLGIKIIER